MVIEEEYAVLWQFYIFFISVPPLHYPLFRYEISQIIRWVDVMIRNSDIAYGKLRMMIMTAELKPGQPLAESELMRELQMGRTPIREALNRLSWEGFVKIVPRQCILVNDIPLSEVEAIYQMRVVLSELESELAVKRRTEEELERLMEEIQALEQETDPRKRVLLDRDFHRTVTFMTRNPFLEREMTNYQDLSTRLLFVNQKNLLAIDNMTVDEHVRIYQSLRDRDVKTLIQTQQSHIISFRSKFTLDTDMDLDR